MVSLRFDMEHLSRLNSYIFHELQDPRTKEWPLLGNPMNMILILTGWLYFVFRAGPRFMKDRKPYQLKIFIKILNIFQVCVNCYFTYEFFAAAWLKNYKLPCTPIDYSNSPDTMRVLQALYLMYIVKFIDLLDTVIYVLRCKNNQITFLHVYHHLYLPFLGWMVLTYAPGGQSIFASTINAIIHAIMYTYYVLAALGPKYQRFLWWKKYLTRLQLLQFVLQFFHILYTQLDKDCYYPSIVNLSFLPFVAILFILFSNFYIKSYLQSRTITQSKME